MTRNSHFKYLSVYLLTSGVAAGTSTLADSETPIIQPPPPVPRSDHSRPGGLFALLFGSQSCPSPALDAGSPFAGFDPSVAAEIRKITPDPPSLEAVSAETSPCPPATVSIVGVKVQLKPFDVDEQHTRDLFVSKHEDLLIKVLKRTRKLSDPFRALLLRHATEKAILKALMDKPELSGNGVPQIFDATGGISEICAFRIAATSHGGDHVLFNLEPHRKSGRAVARIAASAIRVLRDLHAYGIVHGAIGPYNLVVDSDVVTLIDFGYAVPFVTEDGVHIDPTGSRPVTPEVDETQYSVFEFELTPLSRRVDMYRLAEALMIALDLPAVEKSFASEEVDENGDPVSLKEGQDLREAKWNLALDTSIHLPIFNEFHHAMRDLNFAEAPDYDGWICRFQQVGYSLLESDLMDDDKAQIDSSD